MYYFSKRFLEGLQTKSVNFQSKFYEIIDGVGAYLDTEDERKTFQRYIEENHAYDKPGNILYSTQTHFSGVGDDNEKFKEKIHVHLLSLFDSFESEDVMVCVPHIIICLSTTNKSFSEKDMDFLKSIINFERVCRGVLPATVTTILNTNDSSTRLFVAGIK